ncbi:DEAD/DEAH box helicase [Propionibacteriaceae bacterium Y2011]|uniref:DEAD/DEAH box helicase n=1 Tax=Microlunatus sp. Y2014 TaxID=3418488 RepID=UPI003B446449
MHAPLEAVEVAADEVAHLGFAELGLEGNLIDALAKLGAEHPFPIQAVTVPEVLAGRDVLGRGRTGSGKTIAFGAPLVQRIAQSTTQPKGKGGKTYGRKPRALILAPTRELAQQIDRTVQPLARAAGLYTVQIFGGVRQFKQVSALQRGVDIVIGTPGRIEDLIEQGHLDLSEVEITVLDEADLMSEFGFLEPVQRIWRGCRPDGQRLLFSATLDKQVDDLVTEFLREPFIAKMADEDQSTATIEHHVLVVEQRDKGEVLLELASVPGPILVFARTRAYAERLADDLEDAGIKATSLHGNLTQARRTQNLAKLSSGRKQVLVATDVAARGIHLDDISLVVQADMPDDPKTYLHRAGRTGRAGRSGRVVTLIPRNRRRKLAHMLQTAEVSAEMTPVEPGGAVIWE